MLPGVVERERMVGLLVWGFRGSEGERRWVRCLVMIARLLWWGWLLFAILLVGFMGHVWLSRLRAGELIEIRRGKCCLIIVFGIFAWRLARVAFCFAMVMPKSCCTRAFDWSFYSCIHNIGPRPILGVSLYDVLVVRDMQIENQAVMNRVAQS